MRQKRNCDYFLKYLYMVSIDKILDFNRRDVDSKGCEPHVADK